MAKRSASTATRRSPCPISCSLDIFGDQWTLLVVRDLVLGRQRFKEFSASPEGIPTNILADRLKRLLQHGIIEPTEAADGSRHSAYKLTLKGRALSLVLEAVRDWGLKWEKGTQARLMPRCKG